MQPPSPTHCLRGVWERERDFVRERDRLALLLLRLLLLSFLSLQRQTSTAQALGTPGRAQEELPELQLKALVPKHSLIRRGVLPTHCKGSLRFAASLLALF